MNKKTLVALLFFSALLLIFGIFDHEDKYLQKKGNIFGMNVTIPFKRLVIPYLDELTENAKTTQSVNIIYMNQKKKRIQQTSTNAKSKKQHCLSPRCDQKSLHRNLKNARAHVKSITLINKNAFSRALPKRDKQKPHFIFC